MEQIKGRSSFIHNPIFQVICTWLWVVLFPLLAIGVVVGIIKLDLKEARQFWSKHQYFQGYFEAVVAGLLPMLFLWIDKEKLAKYVIKKKGISKSLLPSLS